MPYLDRRGRCHLDGGKFTKRSRCTGSGISGLSGGSDAAGYRAAERLTRLARKLHAGYFVEFNPASVARGRYILDTRGIGSSAKEAEQWIRRHAGGEE